jgi:hypothetical protein
MPRFLTSLLIFLALVPVSATAGHGALRAIAQHRTELSPDGIYVWGDSRVFRGIDVRAVSAATKKPVISWAQNGAGVYDLLVFAERIPANSRAIVGVGVHMLERKQEIGYQHTELSVAALVSVLREGGHSLRDLWTILKRGRDPFVRYGHQPSPGLPIFDDVKRTSEKYYHARFDAKTPPKRYLAKLRLFIHAVKQLVDKDVQVTVVDVPVYKSVQAARDASIYASLGETLRRELGPSVVVMTNIEIPSEPNHFYDLSHLNTRGQKRLTELVISGLQLADSGLASKAYARSPNMEGAHLDGVR